MAVNAVNKPLYKLELLLIKFIPYLIAICYLANTITSYYYKELPILSYIAGLSILPFVFLYVSSFVFRFCIYHRLPLYYVALCDCISYYDIYIGIPLDNRNLFLMNIIIAGLFILVLVFIKFRQHESRNSK